MGNGMLSQEEIDALLRGTLETESFVEQLTEIERDAIGEIANISMGTAASTLSLLLGRKVDITTPRVDITTADQIHHDYPYPSVIVDIKYKAGLEGSNLLILSQRDGAAIVDLMMGGDGRNIPDELSGLHISGIAEAMNQMVGSAATSMSTMFGSVVEITPPQIALNDLAMSSDVIKDFLQAKEPFVRISFNMVVGDVIDGNLIQVLPIDVAKGMVVKLMGGMQESPPETKTHGNQRNQVNPGVSYGPTGHAPRNPYENQGYGAPPPKAPLPTAHTTPVQPAQFTPLIPSNPNVQTDNLNLIMDVPLQVSVELGKARKTIKEILEMGPGTVVELDRLAGEPVDMIVNGKLIAKCEVVVINETFGIRITDIVQPADRIKTLN